VGRRVCMHVLARACVCRCICLIHWMRLWWWARPALVLDESTCGWVRVSVEADLFRGGNVAGSWVILYLHLCSRHTEAVHMHLLCLWMHRVIHTHADGRVPQALEAELVLGGRAGRVPPPLACDDGLVCVCDDLVMCVCDDVLHVRV
jgi:hypothetical protein